MRSWAALTITMLLTCHASGCTQSTESQGDANASSSSDDDAGPGDAGGFVPGGEVTTYQAALGPTEVAPGIEETRCVLVRLDNPEPVLVRRFRTELSEGAHHFIVYRSEQTEEDAEPTTCPGFSGFSTGEVTLFIAQHDQVTLEFPSEGSSPVGLEIDPHQMLRLEMHWLNSGAEPLSVTAKVIVDTIPIDEHAVRADVAFWGTTRLNAAGVPPSDTIAPHSKADTGVMFQRALGDTKSFALTTHQHWRGTRMRVWLSDGPEMQGAPLADAADWAHPPFVELEPPIVFPAAEGPRGSLSDRGLSYRCEYDNGTADEVGFGESAATDEMCFLWHYYYPSRGLHYCLDGECQ